MQQELARKKGIHFAEHRESDGTYRLVEFIGKRDRMAAAKVGS